MRERRFDVKSGGMGCGLVAGVWLAAIGALLISPFGEWLVKGIGWLLIGLGVLTVVVTLLSWVVNRRRPEG